MLSRFDIERAVMASDLPGPSRELMFVLASKIDRRSGAIRRPPSLQQLAREAGRDRRTVMRHLDILDSRGWIMRHPADAAARRDLGRRLHQATGYQLLIPGMGQAATSQGAQRPMPRGAVPPTKAQSAPRAGGRAPQGLGAERPTDQKVSSGGHHRQAATAAEEDLITAVLEEAAMHGRMVSKAQASAIVRQVLAGRAIHTSAQGYVREAIRRTPDKYLPTRSLPNARDLCGICGSSKHVTAYCPEQFTSKEGE